MPGPATFPPVVLEIPARAAFAVVARVAAEELARTVGAPDERRVRAGRAVEQLVVALGALPEATLRMRLDGALMALDVETSVPLALGPEAEGRLRDAVAALGATARLRTGPDQLHVRV